MSKLEKQRALPRASMFAAAEPARAPVKAASRPRKAKEAPSVPVGPFDYGATLERLGLTQQEAAALFGYGLATSYRWKAQGDSIPPWLPRMLALVEHVGIDAARTILAALPAPDGR